MKKFISLLSAILMIILGFAGCGKGQANEPSDTSGSSEAGSLAAPLHSSTTNSTSGTKNDSTNKSSSTNTTKNASTKINTARPNTNNLSGKPDNQNKLTLKQMLAQGQAVQYDRAVLRDPKLGCEVVRTLMPAGWKAGGEVSWNGQSGAYPAIFHFYISEPNGKAVLGYVSACSYEQPDSNWEQWVPGQIAEGSLAQAKAYLSPSDYNLEFFSKLFAFSGVNVLKTNRPDGEAAQVLENMRKQNQKTQDALAAQSSNGNLLTTIQCSVEAAENIVSFKNEGKTSKAKLFSIQSVNQISMQGAYNLSRNRISWEVPFFLYYIAEESVYDTYETEVGTLFLKNFVRNKQWDDALYKACEKLYQNEANRQAAQWQQTQQLIQQQAAANSAASSRNYASSSAADSSSAVMDGWTNVLTDREYYQASDGGYVALDSSYNHTYANSSGGFIQSNNAIDMPSGWDKVSGVGTMLP